MPHATKDHPPDRIYLSPPDLSGKEKEFLLDAFDSNWITTLGPHVELFEQEICTKLGIEAAVAVSSGTAGLHLGLLNLGVHLGDEVFCSDLTFAATANAVVYCGAKPVFVDSNRATWNMDPDLLAEELRSRSKSGKLPRAVIVVDLYGQAADYDPILRTCEEHGVPVIEDAAEALGATYKGKPAGSFGKMGVFSFNGNKIITTSGGGMLVSQDRDFITLARYLATQARDPLPYYQHLVVGYNYRLSNLLAAVGRGQFADLDQKVARRREITAYYEKALADLPGVEFMPEAPYGRSNRWLTCVTIDPVQLGVTNENLRLYLERCNIESRPLWKPMHLQPVFADCVCIGGKVSEDIFARGLCLPSGSGMSTGDLERVVDAIMQCVKGQSSREYIPLTSQDHVEEQPKQVSQGFIPFAIPDLDGSEMKEISDALISGWVTTGPKTKQFEKDFAAYVGAKHAIAVNSCTAAMHLALEAIGVRRGDEVITTPYTFAATAEVIRYFHAHPVFVDVDPRCLNINPDLIERAITKKTKAILPVHIAGLPAEMEAIREVATRHGVPVIEDAAHAFPASYKGNRIGSISEFTCFSFYATKTITTGEGGMITTDNPEWAERCRIMSLHGISKDAWKRYTAEGNWYYEIIAPGYKYNMTDIAAAMGLAQLRKAERMRARRKAIAKRYNEVLGLYDAIQLPADRSDCEHAWHLYMIRLHLHRFVDKSHVMEQLKQRGIGASVHFIPLHMHPYYREHFHYKAQDFPVAHAEYLREISLPIYSRMSDEDVERVIAAVIDIIGQHGC